MLPSSDTFGACQERPNEIIKLGNLALMSSAHPTHQICLSPGTIFRLVLAPPSPTVEGSVVCQDGGGSV